MQAHLVNLTGVLFSVTVLTYHISRTERTEGMNTYPKIVRNMADIIVTSEELKPWQYYSSITYEYQVQRVGSRFGKSFADFMLHTFLFAEIFHEDFIKRQEKKF